MRKVILFLNSNDARRHTGNHGVRGHIFRDHAASADNRVFTNSQAAENRRSRADARASFHYRGNNIPIGIGLQSSAFTRGARILVVDERNIVADENFIFDRYTFANKRMARNLDSAADAGILLNLHERTDLGIIANRAAVEIYKREYSDIFAESDIC